LCSDSLSVLLSKYSPKGINSADCKEKGEDDVPFPLSIDLLHNLALLRKIDDFGGSSFLVAETYS